MRTILTTNAVLSTVSLVVVGIMWHQNRGKFAGISYWLANYALLLGALILIALRGVIVDWASVILSNSMVVVGTFLLVIGLRRFVNRNLPPVALLSFLAVFIGFLFVQTYYTYVQPSLFFRSVNVSAVLAIGCLAGIVMLRWKVDKETRDLSRATSVALTLIMISSIVRIVGFLTAPQSTDDLLNTGTFDAFMVLVLLACTVLFTFNLMLMLTRRLLFETKQLEVQATTVREELKKEFDERTIFVDALIHEVKTPLTAMLASSELLRDELSSDTSAIGELASNMDSAVRNLDRRISELVQYIKLQHTDVTLSLEDLDLSELVHEATSQVAGLLIDRRQTMRVEVEPSVGPIRGDSERIIQILINLLTNANKYGPVGDSILLRATRNANYAITEIHNSAQPLAPSEIELIFMPYQQGRHKVDGGLGMGLYICKKLVQLHGGRIWVETTASGNIFKFSLPLGNPDAIDESFADRR